MNSVYQSTTSERSINIAPSPLLEVYGSHQASEGRVGRIKAVIGRLMRRPRVAEPLPGAEAAEKRRDHIEKIIARNPETVGFQSYEYFVNNGIAVREEFMEATTGNLPIVHTRLSSPEAHRDFEFLAFDSTRALETLLGSERTPQADALFDALEYRQSEMFLVEMSRRMNDETLPLHERVEAAEWFKDATESLYGKPDVAKFGALARIFLQPGLEADFSDDPEAQRIQAELQERIGQIDDYGYAFTDLSAEAKARFKALMLERFMPMVKHITPRYEEGEDGNEQEVEYAPEEMVEAIRQALDAIGATEYGWHCELVQGKNLLGVSAHQKLVEVGADREPISAAVLRGKVVHEVGVHALRSLNAEKAGWTAAAYGMPKYLDAEEALANIAGEAFWDEEKELVPGPEYRSLIAGLVYGLDNHSPRDMRDSFEIMWRMIALDRRMRGKKKADIGDAKKTAFGQCLRMFRGTPTDIPGLIYTKDLAYLNGREIINPILELCESQEDIDLLLAGKLDPSLPDHLVIAEDIVPNPSFAARIRQRFSLAA